MFSVVSSWTLKMGLNQVLVLPINNSISKFVGVDQPDVLVIGREPPIIKLPWQLHLVVNQLLQLSLLPNFLGKGMLYDLEPDLHFPFH